jgi:hypothetical protein
MAALNFPDHDLVTRYTNPDTGITYEWINNSWKSVRTAQTSFVDSAGDNLTGNLTLGTDKIVLNATTGAATFASTVDAAAFTVNGTALSSTIVSSTRPEPANYDAGTMWWNSDSADTSLYVLYQDPTGPNGDAGGKYWVEASPAPDSIGFDGTHTGDSTFTGNMNVTGTVDAGLVNVDGVNVVNTTETGSDIVYTINSGSSLITTQRSKADGSLQIGSIDGNSDTANIELNADGSATFAGQVQSNKNDGWSFEANATFQSGMGAYRSRANNAGASNFYHFYATSSDNKEVVIRTDGSAEFDGKVAVNDNPNHPDEASLNISGANNTKFIQLYDRVNLTNNSFIYDNGYLTYDGTATFAGDLLCGTDLGVNIPGVKLDNSGTVYSLRSADSSAVIFQGGVVGNGTNVQLKADGSATFAGTITRNATNDNHAFLITRDGTQRMRIDPFGGIFIGDSSGDLPDASSKISLVADGSAEFAGAITSGPSAAINGRIRYTTYGTDFSVGSQNNFFLAHYASDNVVYTGFKNDGSASFMGNSVSINSSGSLGRLQVNRTSSGKAFVINDNTSDTVTILGDGSATFKSDAGVKIHASTANTTAVLELAGTRTLGAAATSISKIKSIPENPTANSDDTSLAFETRSQAHQMQEAMRIDSSGRVGIGNSNPSHRLSIAGTANDANSEITITATSVASGYIGANANGLNLGTDTAGIVFKTGVTGGRSVGGTGTERMRIDSVGRFSSQGIYDNTSAVSGNVTVNSSGRLQRATSSSKYKTNIETLEDSYADAILGCRPVWYRSTCEEDNSNYGWWGFIAEEVAEIDPRLVHWKTTEVTYDENGSAVETPCDPEPEGVQYDRFVPHLLNLIKRQKEQIETMKARLTAAGI